MVDGNPDTTNLLLIRRGARAGISNLVQRPEPSALGGREGSDLNRGREHSTRGEEQIMADTYDRYENEGGGGFMMGLLTGTVLGAGLGMLLAPKAGSELRG